MAVKDKTDNLNHASLDHFQPLLESAPDAMIIVDSCGQIVLANKHAEELFEYRREEMLGRPIELLVPERFQKEHVGHRSRYTDQPKLRRMGPGLALIGQTKSKKEVHIEVSLSPMEVAGKIYVVSSIRDVSERKSIEASLRASLAEKEVLLREVHHRVKNNLQVISSLLNYQAGQIDQHTSRQVFEEMRARVRSIALIHERLYQSRDLVHIDLAEYIEGLAADLFESFGVQRNQITLSIRVGAVSLDVDTVVNLGLILNELLSNALKYAFPDGRRGTIEVSISELPSMQVELIVRDNGVGIVNCQALESNTTLGLKLVRGLAKEMGGNLEVRSQNGCEFRVICNTQSQRSRS